MPDGFSRDAPPKTPDTRVLRATIHAESPDHSLAIPLVRSLEQALFQALEEIGRDSEQELIIIKKISLSFRALANGSGAAIGLERSVQRALRARVAEAKRRPERASGVAYFPSLAAAVAEHLAAIRRGQGDAWPFPLLPINGSTWSEILQACASRGAAFTGDVLGHLCRLISLSDLSAGIPEAAARELMRLWSVGNDWFAIGDLPDSVRTALAEAASALASGGASVPARRLALLAALFAAWPPARLASHREEDLNALLDPAAEREAPRWVSRAGGLVAWASLFDRTELLSELRDAYPEVRQRRAVLWAIGRALEDPALSSRDPLLLAWSGEEPGRAIAPAHALAEADPEKLHALAVRVATRSGGSALRIVPFGAEIAVLMPNGVVADALPALADLHAAVQDVVQRFVARAGIPPTEVEVVGVLESADRDAVSEVDVPSLPERWRPAVRAVASVARRLLEESWRLRLRDMHHWPAVVVGSDGVEIRRADAMLASDVRWAVGVPFSDGARRVTLV